MLISRCQTRYRLVCVSYALFKLTLSVRKSCHRGVAADVAAVARKTFEVIVLGLVVVLLVLLKVVSVDVKLFYRRNFTGTCNRLSDLNRLFLTSYIRCVRNESLALARNKRNGNVVYVSIASRYCLYVCFIRCEVGAFSVYFTVFVFYENSCVYKASRNVESDEYFIAALFKIYSGIYGSIFYVTDVADGIQVLLEVAAFVRSKPGEVGLIVRVYTGHELDVRSVFVGKV